MVERGGLENRCTLQGYRGFESHSLRQIFSKRAAISMINREGGPKPARPNVTGVQRALFQISKLSP